MEKKKEITLPKYSLGEELISSISHGIGALLALAALVLCIVFSAIHNNTLGIISSCIYGTSTFLLYLMSCLYHALKPNAAKKVFRVFDHCSIFLLIAGSYTPFLLLTVGGTKGLVMLTTIWTAAILGIIFNSIDLEKFNKISFVLYIVMGWMVVFSFDKVMKSLSTLSFTLLLVGGIVYTVGAVLYLAGNKIKYMHSIWHFFVLAGSIFQFFPIFFCVMG